MMNTLRKKLLLPSITLLVFIWMACDPGDAISTGGDIKTCEGCHTNKDLLKELIVDSPSQSTAKITGVT